MCDMHLLLIRYKQKSYVHFSFILEFSIKFLLSSGSSQKKSFQSIERGSKFGPNLVWNRLDLEFKGTPSAQKMLGVCDDESRTFSLTKEKKKSRTF